ncbi:MAG: hypothetical protein Kow0099_31850 [Candidatus Abyssubacteria bacterium]
MDRFDLANYSFRQTGVGETQLRLQYLRSPDADTDPERLRAAARELESYFLHLLIREMRKTVPPNPLIHGGRAEEIFQDFLDEQTAAEIARSNQLGLADQIYKSLVNLLKSRPETADNV